uniref:Uncharacterized protein n=1 Tax=Anopheles minimus TaxID=112268 RepID=A0A182WN86_9DIPT
MKAVVVFFCLIALANAQVLLRSLNQPPPNCLPGDVYCQISARPGAQLRDLNDDTLRKNVEPTVEGIGKLVAWIVNKVVDLINGDTSMVDTTMEGKMPSRQRNA